MTDRERLLALLAVARELRRLHEKSALGGCEPFEVGTAIGRLDAIEAELKVAGVVGGPVA